MCVSANQPLCLNARLQAAKTSCLFAWVCQLLGDGCHRASELPVQLTKGPATHPHGDSRACFRLLIGSLTGHVPALPQGSSTQGAQHVSSMNSVD